MIQDYFLFAFRSIKNRRMRSWLTILGIFVGIAAVVGLISIGQGMQDAINDQFEMMGSDKITIMPGSNMMEMMMAAIPLTDDDIEIIVKVRGVEGAVGFVSKTAAVEFRDQTKFALVLGMPLDESRNIIDDMQQFTIKHGRNLKETDKYTALIGIEIAEGNVFEKEVKLRDKITINKKDFKVVGIMERIGNKQDDSQIYIPMETARVVLDEPEDLMMIMVQVKEGIDPAKVAEDIEEVLRDERDEDVGEESFSVSTSEQLMDSMGDILGMVQAVIIGIAGISLFVGGIGIMNTMYTTVLERTKEIGIMKAVGARNSNVMLMFLIESGILGMVGGGIGCLLGILMAKGVDVYAAQAGFAMLEAHLSFSLIMGALLFSFLVGCISGVLPARQAANLKPVDALRYE